MKSNRQPPRMSGARSKPLAYGVAMDILRRAADLTDEELAKESGVDVKTVERACSGRGAITVPHLLRILRVLKPDMVKRLLRVFPPEHFEAGAL